MTKTDKDIWLRGVIFLASTATKSASPEQMKLIVDSIKLIEERTADKLELAKMKMFNNSLKKLIADFLKDQPSEINDWKDLHLFMVQADIDGGKHLDKQKQVVTEQMFAVEKACLSAAIHDRMNHFKEALKELVLDFYANKLMN